MFTFLFYLFIVFGLIDYFASWNDEKSTNEKIRYVLGAIFWVLMAIAIKTTML